MAVVAVSLDRFGRDLVEQLRSKKELTALRVPLHFTRDGGELDDDQTVMRGWLAQKEVQKLGERVSASKRTVAELGLPPSGPPPWGYRWRLPQTPEEERAGVGRAIRRVLVVADSEARAVRELFARAAKGETLGALARWVASLSEEQRGGRTLNRSAIGKVLHSATYVARYSRDAAVSTPDAILALPVGQWTPLIADGVWLTVQRRLDSHQAHPRQASGDYLLTGYLRCSLCGGRMNGWSSKRQDPRYRCSSSVLGGEATARRCFATADLGQLDADVLRQVGAVVDTLTRLAHTDERVLTAARKTWAQLQTPKAKRGAPHVSLERAIARLRTRLKGAREKLYDGVISREEYDADTETYRRELDAKQAEIAKVAPETKAGAASLPDFDEALASVETMGEDLASLDVRAQREALIALVERVTPERTGRGEYAAKIEWTPLGEALHGMAGAL